MPGCYDYLVLTLPHQIKTGAGDHRHRFNCVSIFMRSSWFQEAAPLKFFLAYHGVQFKLCSI